MNVPRALLPLVALAAACAARQVAPEVKPPPPKAEDLVALSRAMTAADVASQTSPADPARARCTDLPPPRPEEVVARYLMLYAMPRDEQSWSCFRDLAEKYPDSPWGYLGTARLDLAWGALDKAEAGIVQALEVAPKNWIAVLYRGHLHERRDEEAEARADYAAVLGADPASPEAHLGLARLLRKSGDAQGAIAEAEAALAAAPGLYPALALRATLALDLRDRKQAAAYAEKAAAACPRDYESLAEVAALLAEAGDLRGAIERWRAALALREEPAVLKSLARVARSAGDPGAELEAVARLTHLEPTRAEWWRRLAELELAKGDAAAAAAALHKAVERDPGHAPSRLALGRILESRGEAGAALAHYRAAGDQARNERLALERKLNVERLPSPDAANVQKAVGALVDRTYRARLREMPSLSGQLEMLAVVDADGSAIEVQVVEDTVRDEWVRSCAYWNLKDAGYPKGEPTRYTFRFTLRK